MGRLSHGARRKAIAALGLALLWGSAAGATQVILRGRSAAPPELRQEPKRKPRVEALLTYGEAMRAAMRGDYMRALDLLRRVAALDPTAPQPHVAMAELYYQLRNPQQARQEAELALELNPREVGAHRILGRLLREEALATRDREKARRAVEAFRKVVAEDDLDVEAWQSLAQLYAFLEDTEGLKEALERWTGGDPTADEAFYRLALIYFDRRQYRQAAENAARALMTQPESEYAILLAKSLLYQGHTTEALQVYREALDRDPSNSELRINYAEALIFSGRYDEAIEILQRILTEQPRNLEALRLTAQAHRRAGRRAEAIQTLKRALTDSAPDESLNVRFVLAQTYEEVGQVDEAIATYEEILKALLAPDGAVPERHREAVEMVLTNMALAYRHAGRREEAFRIFERMRRVLGERSPRADLLIVDTFREERDFEAMLAHAQEAARRYPQERRFRLLQAQALGRLGRLEEALRLLDGLLTGLSEDIEVLSTKALVLSEAERYAEAEAVVQEALRRDPRNNGLLIQLSLIQERLGRFAEAEATLRQVLERDADNATALNNLGYYLAERGERLDEALELIRRAVNIEPTNGAFLDSLGWVYFQLGNLEEAERYLEQAVLYQPRDATIHEHLGDLHQRRGRLDQALRAYERALQLATESRERERLQQKLEKLRQVKGQK
ncbi:Beta-barrel assembly-enhancing protease [bacterium HR08]|nr:Beta-barrel assembly-enhancing protease [bacterium HR08]